MQWKDVPFLSLENKFIINFKKSFHAEMLVYEKGGVIKHVEAPAVNKV